MKFTEEQKAKNKAARSARDKAYSNRMKEYLEALELASANINDSDENREFKIYDSALRSMLDSQREVEENIQKRIAELRLELDATIERHIAERAPVVEERVRAHGAFMNIREAETKKVKDRFKDVINCYGAAGWKKIEDFY